MTDIDIEYQYNSSSATYDSSYLVEPVLRQLKNTNIEDNRLFELGCGNGYITKQYADLGLDVTAVDTSESGIRHAQKSYPNCRFEVASAYDDLAKRFGTFDCVVSLEVVEHVFSPKKYANTLFSLVKPQGTAIVSTPYHGYLKNLSIALLNKFDSHVDPLWEGGHIKFWSVNTLTKLLINAGFKQIDFVYAGRHPWLAKSMIAIARK